MRVEEHFYADDPNVGHPDVKTMPDGADYFFLGNGRIEAAVQHCTVDGASPLGLLLMDPGSFGPKRSAFTLSAQDGLAATLLKFEADGEPGRLDPRAVRACWDSGRMYPCVLVEYNACGLAVSERFYCVDLDTARLIREVELANLGSNTLDVHVETGVLSQSVEMTTMLGAGESEVLYLEYELRSGNGETIACVSWTGSPDPSSSWIKRNEEAANCSFGDSTLDHLFRASKVQLPAVVSSTGAMDASIWQYNHEWTRDSSMAAIGLTMLGHFEVAHAMLERIISTLVTTEGDTVDSGTTRSPSEVELDQNGILLYALKTYVDWTGDLNLVRSHWDRFCALAEFPLKSEFDHPETSLRCNTREFWERHALHGISPGFELTYQTYVSFGLQCAADLARRLGHAEEADRWWHKSAKLKEDLLEDPVWGLVVDGRLVKRRSTSGALQETIEVIDASDFPDGIPLVADGMHALEPDTGNALPIALGLVDPRGNLAANTLNHLEGLWNQTWDGGGYSRYNVTSEPDSPGPWPFPSVFVARAWLENGNLERVWDILRWLSSAPGSEAGTFFEFYGPRPIPPWPQIGPIPWTWAELAILFIQHILGVRPDGRDLVIQPRLLPGIGEIDANIRLGKGRLRIRKTEAAPSTHFSVRHDGSGWTGVEGRFVIPDYLTVRSVHSAGS